MERGEVVRTAAFTEAHADGVTLGWKPPKGKVFVFVLLGVEDKAITEESVPLDPEAVFNDMGWFLREPSSPKDEAVQGG